MEREKPSVTIIPLHCLRAIDKARKERLAARLILGVYPDGTAYSVRSTSQDGEHLVKVSTQDGKVVNCSDCPGWANGHFCKHAGCVALHIMNTRFGRYQTEKLLERSYQAHGIPSKIRSVRRGTPANDAELDGEVETARTTKNNPYREAS